MKKISLILFFIQFSFAGQNEIQSAVQAMLAQHLKNVERYEVEFRTLPREVQKIDAASSVLVVDEPRATYKGLLTIPVDVTTHAGVRQRFFVGVRVRTFETVAVSTKLINRHEEISCAEGAANIAYQVVETTMLPDDVLKKSNSTNTLRSKLVIAAGRPLTAALVETHPLVAAGSIVLVNLHTDNIKLSFNGKAKEDGWNGNIIAIELKEMKRSIRAKVIDGYTVEMVE